MIRVNQSASAVLTPEFATPPLYAVYHLSRQIDVEWVEMSDAYWEMHRLEKEGRLPHPIEECPERRSGMEVRVWSGGSWQRVLTRQAMSMQPEAAR